MASINSVLLLFLTASLACEAECQDLSGDICTINVDLPEEVVYDVTVTDTLPRGLIYKNDSLNIKGASTSPEESISSPNDGTQDVAIIWSFGTVNNSDDRDIKICFGNVIANVSGNEEGAILRPSRARLSWHDSRGFHTSSDESVPVEIVEPKLIIEKSMPASARIGEIVTCTISICHAPTSSANAFDVDVAEMLPAGLSYCPGSMEVISGPPCVKDDSNSSELKWHFSQIDAFGTESPKILLRYNATAQRHGSYYSNARLLWTSAQGINPHERKYQSESKSCIEIKKPQTGIQISKKAQLDTAYPGCILNYTVEYENSEGMARGVTINETYDSNTIFLSAHPMPDSGKDNFWTIGDMNSNSSGIIEISVRVKPSVQDGTELNNTVEISDDTSRASASARTTVRTNPPSLVIDKMASSDFIRPGGEINYTITFRNDGQTPAANVSVTDIVDGHLKFDPADATPVPTNTWSDSAGTHILWDAKALNSSILLPGEMGRIDLKVSLPLVPEHPDIDRVYNLYEIDSDNATSKLGSLETFVIHSIFVRKWADKYSCARGDVVNYTIIYGNDLAVEAKNAVVTDKLQGMDYVYASPQPEIKGDLLVWKLGSLPPHTRGAIILSVRIGKWADIIFHDTQSVSGKGYVSSSQMLSTSTGPKELFNYVDISAKYLGQEEHDSSSAKIKLTDSAGTKIESLEKGSGNYHQDQAIDYNSRGRRVSLDKQISASHEIVNILLSRDNITADSLWAAKTMAINSARNEEVSEDYRYMNRFDWKASVLLDENQTVYSSQSEFGDGMAQIGYLKHGSGSNTMEASEDYRGSFNLHESVDSYGIGAVYSKSSSGSGFVSSYKYAGPNLKSYEHGSGFYNSNEEVTSDPIIKKDVNMSYAASAWSAGDLHVVYAGKWGEGMSAKNPVFGSTIGESISYADYIRKDSLVDSSSLTASGEFTGIGSLEASVWNRSTKEETVNMDETLIGKYSLNVAMGIHRKPRHLGPHISVTKEARKLKGDIVLFRINITNDGNKTLAPIVISDALPEEMVFINSSLRPSISGRNISWALISLSSGSIKTIEFRARLKENAAWKNNVRVAGYYRDEIIMAEASCAAIQDGLPSTAKALGLGAQNNSTGFTYGSWAVPSCIGLGAGFGDCINSSDVYYYDDDYEKPICRSCVQ